MGLLAIFLYLIELYIRPQDWMQSMYGFPLVDFIGGAGLIITLIYLFHPKKTDILPQIYFVFAYLVMVFLSNILAGHTDEAVVQFIDFSKRTVILFMVFFMVKNSKQLKKIISLIIILTVILAVQGILHGKYGISVYGQNFIKQNNRIAWIGSWDGPNVLCLLFVLAIALALGFISRPYNIFWRIINVIFIGILIYGVYLTNSRGGYLGLLAVVSVFLWNKFIRGKKLFIKAFSFTICVVVIIAFSQFGPSRMAELNSEESSAHERTWLWETGLNITRSSPLFGVGKKQFLVDGYSMTHNNFVQDMAEMGLIGLFIYVGLIYLSLKGLYSIKKIKNIDKFKNSPIPGLANSLFMSMVGFSVVTYFVTMQLEILFLWFGLCAVAVNIARKESGPLSLRFSIRDAGMVVLTMVVIIFSIYLIAIKEII